MELKLLLVLTGCATAIYARTSAVLSARQSTAPPPPAGWVSAGCYSDTPDSRTLRVASFTSVDNMTVEACAAFCTPNSYTFFGVEFGRECYCDFVIEIPAIIETDGGCNMPCTGNAAEICGGPDRINVYIKASATTTTTNAPTPTPTIKQTVGTFQYKGCFQDVSGTQTRTLAQNVTVPGGVNAEGCTTSCKAAGYPLAGLELGNSCWCDSFMENVNVTPDSDCNTPCQADSTQACGATSRLSVYQDTTASPPDVQQCLSNAQLSLTVWRLQAIPAPGGGTSTKLTSINISGTESSKVRKLFILTTDTGTIQAPDSLPLLILEKTANISQNGPALLTGVVPAALSPNVGGGQFFLEENADFSNFTPPYNDYCAKPNPLGLYGPFIGPPLLAINGRTDQWALCPNVTAGGRVDVVYAPVATSPDYSLSQCQNVFIEIKS